MLLPCPALRHMVSAYAFCELEEDEFHIIPRYTQESLIFIYSDFFSFKKENTAPATDSFRIVTGSLTEPLQFGRESFRIKFVIVVLKPWVMPNLVRGEMSFVTRKTVSISDLSGVRDTDWITDALINAENNAVRAAHLDVYLSQILQKIPLVNVTVLDEAYRLILNSGGQIRVSHLAKKLNLNERKLQRLFLTHKGLTPREMIRIVKMERIFWKLLQTDSVDWARFAVDHDFSDQSHFIKTFKEHCILTPAEFLKRPKLDQLRPV